MKHLLINASNLLGGGGLAVATSYIVYLSTSHLNFKVSLLISSPLYLNLISHKVKLDSFSRIEVFDSSKNLTNLFKLKNKLVGYDCVFTVFGPPLLYWKINSHHIIGFALPWIIYKKNNVPLPFFEKKFILFKNFIKQFFFLYADCLIVELDHVKNQLESNLFLKKLNIKIIHSEVDQIFFNKDNWENLKFPQKKNNTYFFGIISKNYPHKNIYCLLQVKKILQINYSMNVEFFVTFEEKEWEKCSAIFKKEINNLGPIKLAQCPTFYDHLDGVIFPSLLECFSAVPIESLYMKVPLFASNYHFIYDCCENHSQYFDPLDPYDIAYVIYKYFLIPELQRIYQLEEAHMYIKDRFITGTRGIKYNNLILEYLNK